MGLVGIPSKQRLKDYLAKEAIAKVRSGKAAFAIIPMIKELPDDLTSQEVAYDALAVFVNFSYSEREQELPIALDG